MINDMPVGLNITGRVKEDDVVLNMANYVEKVTGLKDIYSKVGDIDV
jgi:Asp-tRNA(Asn)/Glu-tRNA(Gln) amidotransferase A subunit family amidase